MRIRWRLSKVGRRSCCRWQYSQASPMLHSPLEKRMHGRRHRWGCPRLPLPPRFSGITAPTSTGTGCTGSCSGTAGAATAGAATAGAATAVQAAQGLVALPALVGNWCWSSAAGGPHTQHTPHWMRPAVELVSSLAYLGCEKTAETLPRLTAAGVDSISISFPVKKSPFATLCECNFPVKQKGPPPRFDYPAPVRSENDAWRVHRRGLHR